MLRTAKVPPAFVPLFERADDGFRKHSASDEPEPERCTPGRRDRSSFSECFGPTSPSNASQRAPSVSCTPVLLEHTALPWPMLDTQCDRLQLDPERAEAEHAARPPPHRGEAASDITHGGADQCRVPAPPSRPSGPPPCYAATPPRRGLSRTGPRARFEVEAVLVGRQCASQRTGYLSPSIVATCER